MNEIKQAAIESLNDYSLKQILNSAPNMIHEKDYKELNCVLCNKLMKKVHDTHCAFPLAKLQSAKEAFKNPENHSRCCSVCNRDVMAERFKMMCGYRKKNKSNRPINEPLEKIKIEMTSIPMNEPLEKIKLYELKFSFLMC
jgi:hypothetical protein